MTITMVKKIKADGTPCRKCEEVTRRLEDAGLTDHIDEIVIADENNPESKGMLLAEKYNIDRAPFFIVEEDGAEPRIYTVFMKFLREVLQTEVSEADAARDIIDASPDLDYI